MAITWRNVDAPNFTGANILLRDAGDRIGTGFDGFRKVFDENTQNQQKALEQTKNYNTGQFLDRLAGYRDPAALEAAIQSGEINQLRQQFGAMINQDQVRNAVDDRGSFLRKEATERMGYQNTAQDFADAPIRDRLLAEARQIDVSDPSKVEAQLNLLEGKIAESGLSARGQAAAAQGLVDIRKSLFGDYKATQDMANAKTRLGLEASRTSAQLRESDQRMRFAQDNQAYLLQGRAATALASKALEGADDLATARNNYMELSKDLPAEHRDKGLGQLAQLYTNATGITPEQDEEIQRMLAPFDAEIKVAQEYVNSKPTFAQAEQDKVTEGVAITEAMKRTPGEEDNTSRKIQDQVRKFRSARKLGDDVNLGAVLQESLRRVGVDEATFGDDTLDTSKLSDIMDQVYNDFVTYQGYQEKLRAAEQSKSAAQQELKGRYKIRNAFNFSPPK